MATHAGERLSQAPCVISGLVNWSNTNKKKNTRHCTDSDAWSLCHFTQPISRQQVCECHILSQVPAGKLRPEKFLWGETPKNFPAVTAPNTYNSIVHWTGKFWLSYFVYCKSNIDLPNSTKRLLSEFGSFRPRRRGEKQDSSEVVKAAVKTTSHNGDDGRRWMHMASVTNHTISRYSLYSETLNFQWPTSTNVTIRLAREFISDVNKNHK